MISGTGLDETDDDCETGTSGMRRIWICEDQLDDPVSMIEAASAAVSQSVSEKRTPIVLGGEHTVSIGTATALCEHYDDFGIVTLDAHADLRHEYEGNSFSHACTLRRIREDLQLPVAQIGVRSYSRQEAADIKENMWIVLTPWKLREDGEYDALLEALSLMPENIFLNIDLDVLDPSEAPGVGNPEPGGLGWYELLDVLYITAQEKNLLAADVVEFLPLENDRVTLRLAARLVEKLASVL